MAETLTAQQQAAVENRGGSLLVSAAAGSGKTKVLVERLFRYVTEEGRDMDDFLLITYTKAAAAEMRGKIAAELSRRMGQEPENQHLRRQLLRVYQADIKTVDSFCTALLRENTHLLAEEGERYALTPDFRVLDQGEADLLREQVLRRELEAFYETLTPGGELLADTMGAGRDDRSLEALVLEVYEKLQSHASPAVWLERSRKAWADLDGAFDATPWAAELLEGVRREAAHWGEFLRRGAARTEGDAAFMKGYGEKFLSVSFAMEELASAISTAAGSGAGIWDAARAAADRIAFPRLSTPKGRKDEPLARSLKQIWDAAKDGLADMRETLSTSGADAMADLRLAAPAMIALLDLVAAFSERYRLEKRRRNAADFSDQEHLALKLLTEEDGEPTRLGRQIAARYVEILVDEYQDTNEVQNAIFRAVSREGKNLFAVGDVKQSIYRFRLADPAIFLEKYRRFVPWEEARAGEGRKILLSKNFRSRKEILDAANFVFSNILSPEMGEMEYGAEEALYFGAAYYPERTDCAAEFHLIGAKRASANAANSQTAENAANPAGAENAVNAQEGAAPIKRLTAEARFVARRIRQLLDGAFPVTDSKGVPRPCRPEDIVILLRSPRSRTAAFYEALSRENIPCSFEERGGFYHTMEVSTMVSLLQVIDNPRQDVPLIALLRSPLFGFTPDRLAEIRGRDRAGDYYDAMKAEAEKVSGAAADGEQADANQAADGTRTDAVRQKSGSDCAAFLDLLEEFRRAALDLDTHQLIWQIYNRLNVIGVFSAMDGGAERRENLLAFTRQAERYESGGYRGLFAFITQLGRLIASGRADESGGGSVGGGVRLMSIHRSKGLEFPIVILADLDRAFSRQDFTAPVLVHPEMGLGPRFVDLDRRIRYPTLARLAVESRLRRENLAEEQRILYVAMTRAKEKLILVDSVYGAGETLQKRSAGSAYPMPPEIVAKGKSFGDWLLPLLLNRPEGGVLREAAGLEAENLWAGSDSPWRIFFHDAETFRERPGAASAEAAAALEPVTAEKRWIAAETFDQNLLEFVYPFRRESNMPAKVTATQLKGRTLDEEIAENAAHTPRPRPLTQPRFRWREHGLTAAERGTATHLLLQYLDFSGPDPAEQAAALAEKKLLTAEQAAAVDIEAIRRFLASPLAVEIRNSPAVLREYRFTLLLDAAEYDPEAKSGDSILLQGVVDCCFETAAGWTVVDFKTDHVYNREALAERAEHYRPQLNAYSRALERVLEKNVVRRVLYFLSPGKTVEIP